MGGVSARCFTVHWPRGLLARPGPRPAPPRKPISAREAGSGGVSPAAPGRSGGAAHSRGCGGSGGGGAGGSGGAAASRAGGRGVLPGFGGDGPPVRWGSCAPSPSPSPGSRRFGWAVETGGPDRRGERELGEARPGGAVIGWYGGGRKRNGGL